MGSDTEPERELNPQVRQVLDTCMEKVREAGNAFLGKYTNDERTRERLAKAVQESLEFLGEFGRAQVIKVKQADQDSKLMLTVSMPPALAMALVALGLMCPHCYSADFESIKDSDFDALSEALNKGYHPSMYKRCHQCGEYIEIKEEDHAD